MQHGARQLGSLDLSGEGPIFCAVLVLGERIPIGQATEPTSQRLGDLPDADSFVQLGFPQFTETRSPVPGVSDSDSHSQGSSAMSDDKSMHSPPQGQTPQNPIEAPMPTWLPHLLAGMQAASIGGQQPPGLSQPAPDTNALLMGLMARLGDGQQQQAAQFAAFQQTMVHSRQQQAGAGQGSRGGEDIPGYPQREFQLKASDVGKFEPRDSLDPIAAQHFIDNITYSVRTYGEDRTRAVLRRCCESPRAQRWLCWLSTEEKDDMNTSTAHWITYLTHDFMPPPGKLQLEALMEQFDWSQNRTPMEYATKKINLLRIAGIVDQDTIVNAVHAGFQSAAALMVALQPHIRARGNAVSDYKAQIALVQGPMQKIYEEGRVGSKQGRRNQAGSGRSEYQSRNVVGARESGGSGQRKDPAGLSYTSPPASGRARKTTERVGKCRFYPDPECGDGEHWDRECKLYGKNHLSKPRRSYYIRPEIGGDVDIIDSEEAPALEEFDQDEALAEKYDRAQSAYFCEMYFSAQSGFHALARASDKAKEPESAHVCNKCKETFKSGNALHRHLKEVGHSKNGQDPVVVKSKVEVATDPTADLHDYHYVKLPFSTHPAGVTHLACMDTGYGNSAVDRNFLCKYAAEATRITLPRPQWVLGMGGGKKLLDEVAMLTIYLKGIDGRSAAFTRPFHVFEDLSVPLLVGIDIIVPEDLVLTFKPVPMVTIGSCEGIQEPVTLKQEQRYRKILVRVRNPVKLPPRRTMKVDVRFSQKLDPNETYLFSPSRLHSASSAGMGAPHAMVTHDQSQIAFTNFLETPVQLFKGTVIGTMQPMQGSYCVAWEGAQQEVRALFGEAIQEKQVFDPEGITPTGFPPAEVEAMGDMPAHRARMAPGRESVPAEQQPEKPCKDEVWEMPAWIQDEYKPVYSHALPRGIKTPTTATSTWKEVNINEADDVSPEQVEAMRLLVRRHKAIFNDEMGCVRESPGDWLRIPVDPALELKVKPKPPYRMSPKGRAAIDKQFEENTLAGRIEPLTKPSPYTIQVFVVYAANGKERPVLDMRELNALVPHDGYPLPDQSRIMESIGGKRWLATADITSAFYQRLLHPEDRY